MLQELDIDALLTPDELEQVRTVAEFLISRRPRSVESSPPQSPISFEGWAGCSSGIKAAKSDKELKREAWDAATEKFMKD